MAIPKAAIDIVDVAIGEAVEQGILWLVSGPASIMSEEIPAGLLMPDVILLNPRRNSSPRWMCCQSVFLRLGGVKPPLPWRLRLPYLRKSASPYPGIWSGRRWMARSHPITWNEPSILNPGLAIMAMRNGLK